MALVLRKQARNGHGTTHDRLMRDIEKEMDTLAEKILQSRHQSDDRMVAEIRESAAGIVARVDLNAREREVDARNSKRA